VQQVLVAVPASQRKRQDRMACPKGATCKKQGSVGGAYGGIEIDIDSLNLAIVSQLVLGVIFWTFVG
jgi:hypothetical protein